MNTLTSPRFDHLRRMTDSQGLLRTARGDVPDRFSGYDTIDNATALRLCAVGTETVDAELSHVLARTYYGFLSRGRRYDSGVRHRCDSTGGWTNTGEDDLVQSYVGRAIASVMVSELPINIRLSAAEWWRMLLESSTPHVHTPLAAANWLIALGQLRAADPGRDLARAENFAHWIVEDLYYPNRTTAWEWFQPTWTPMAALVPTSLWYAYHILGERRIFRVAQAMTRFVMESLFEDQMLQPPGTSGIWSLSSDRAGYNQTPSEVCSIVELLCTAERFSGSQAYGEYAEVAARWFNGRNTRHTVMIDQETGGCYDALTDNGVENSQSASATLSCLLTYAALAARPIHAAEPGTVVHAEGQLVYGDPSIGS